MLVTHGAVHVVSIYDQYCVLMSVSSYSGCYSGSRAAGVDAADCVVLVGMQVTANQLEYLVALGVLKKEAAKLSKSAASDLISKKLQEKETQPPTAPQLKLLSVRMVLLVLRCKAAIQQEHGMRNCGRTRKCMPKRGWTWL